MLINIFLQYWLGSIPDPQGVSSDGMVVLCKLSNIILEWLLHDVCRAWHVPDCRSCFVHRISGCIMIIYNWMCWALCIILSFACVAVHNTCGELVLNIFACFSQLSFVGLLAFQLVRQKIQLQSLNLNSSDEGVFRIHLTYHKALEILKHFNVLLENHCILRNWLQNPDLNPLDRRVSIGTACTLLSYVQSIDHDPLDRSVSIGTN